MSTRYVYSIYNTTAAMRSTKLVEVTTSDLYKKLEVSVCNKYEQKIAKNRAGEQVAYYTAPHVSSGDPQRPIYTDLNATTGGHARKFETIAYKYVVVTLWAGVQGGEPIVSESYLLELFPSDHGAYWGVEGNLTTAAVWNCNSDSIFDSPTSTLEKLGFYVSGGDIAQGSSLLRTVSSRAALETGAFIDAGVFRWRAYKGSDTIDPSAVTYSKQDLYPGEPVTISVTPVTPTYGGTVSYLYQYSIDGGSTWKNIGSKTTNTSVSITIPEGALQFQSRVTASDGWGFTSTTPVLGPSLGVSQLKAYAAVSGTSRAGVKMYATVGGKVKEIQKGYAIIGRKVHKIF